MKDCKFHIDHANRIKALEVGVKENQIALRSINPKIWVAVLALIGSVFSTVGTIVGMFLVAYLKSKGMM